jgi:hypothetical protein
MLNDARENYKSVFGVYPNERLQPYVEPPDPDQPRKLALALERTANDLFGVWNKFEFAGVSPQAQDLLREIQVASAALRREILKANAGS